jgi:hypothetical protein
LILPYAVIIVMIWWLKSAQQWGSAQGQRAGLFAVFYPDYWQKNGEAILRYLKDENFTSVFALLALSGILLAFLSRRKGRLQRYLMGWGLAVVPYCMVYADQIYQNNYVQMPFLAPVCIGTAYALWSFCLAMKRFARNGLVWAFLLVFLGSCSPFVYRAIARMYGTVFVGVDVAGESLKALTRPEDRIFLLTHAQGYGIARYARRYMGWPADLQDFKDKESRFKIKYLCAYPVELIFALEQNHPDIFNYILKNYHFKEAGLTDDPRRLYYVILEKGKGSASKDFLRDLSGSIQLRTIYRMFGKYLFFYSLRGDSIKMPQ